MSAPSAPTRAAGSSQPPSAANGPDSSRCQPGLMRHRLGVQQLAALHRRDDNRRRRPGNGRPVPGQPPQAVVVEDLRVHRVVGAAVHVRPVLRRDQRDRRHPGQRDHDRDQPGQRDVGAAGAQPRRGRGQQVGGGQRGQRQPGLDHLRLERQANPDARDQQRSQRPGQQRGRGGVGRQHQQQDQQRVGHVAAAQQHRDRRDREHRGGRQPGRRPGQPADRPVQDQDREHALDHLRQDQRPDVKAEDPQRQRLHPERARQLVDGDGPGRIERPEDEVVPALRHAAGGRAVERLDAGAGHSPAVADRGQDGDGEQGRPRPRGLIRGRAPRRQEAAPAWFSCCGRRRRLRDNRHFRTTRPVWRDACIRQITIR